MSPSPPNSGTRVTPNKGVAFEERIHDLLASIAVGLGDEYADTTSQDGLLPRSKKGDGVLSVQGGPTRVVLEMTDSRRTGWSDYLDEAERNRGAAAALGIVRTPEQNVSQTIRVLGPRRIVMSFNPDEDDPELLRTAVMLLRTVALVATGRTGSAEVTTAEERIAEALAHLDKLDTVKKLANGIQRNATKIDGECAGISAAIHRLLAEALAALGGPEAAQTEPAAWEADVA
ncbi:MAG: hypothetical protein ACJ73E_09680 [Mycobacteriales bacterium]